jgi:hypothetical protein
MKRRLGVDPRQPLTWVVAVFVVTLLVGSGWNLPCNDGWSNDELAPRSSMLGAAFQTYLPGQFFRYPPLHGLVLFVSTLPVLVVLLLRAKSWGEDEINQLAMLPAYATPSMVVGRLVALAMAIGLVVNTYRLWKRLGGERVGTVAAILIAFNPMVVYFAHTTSVDVPSWFWMTWTLVELDRVAAGEPRERPAMLLITASLLTKDQTAFVLLGAMLVCWAAVPLADSQPGARWRALSRPRLVKAGAWAAVVYLLMAGAWINPHGFAKKLAFVIQGNIGWTSYERTWAGALEQVCAIVESMPIFGAAWIPMVALGGLVLGLRGAPRSLGWRRAMPLVASLTYLGFFVIPSRWTMERHLWALSGLLFPYVGFAVEWGLGHAAPRVRWATWALAALTLGVNGYGIACVDGSLIADSRNLATRFLRELPVGTRVEVYGGNQYLPHLPPHLNMTRIGHDLLKDRPPLPSVQEIQGDYRRIEERQPEYLVVSESVLRFYAPLPAARLTDLGRKDATDPDAHPFFAALEQDALPYRRVLRATCDLPWPLTCRRIHLSTGAETWIYQRTPGATSGPVAVQ